MSLATELVAYLKAPASDLEFVTGRLEEAAALVAQATGALPVAGGEAGRLASATVPDLVLDLAVREVAADLYHRRRVRNGVSTFEGADVTPIRVTRDPMKAAEDILRPFLTAGIA